MTPLARTIADVTAGGVPRAYKPNAVPPKPVYPYTVVTVTEDLPGNYGLDGAHGTKTFRATLQSFDSDADGALDFDLLARNALQDHAPELDGYDTTPWRVQVGSALVRDPDNQGVVGVTTTLTCTASKETP